MKSANADKCIILHTQEEVQHLVKVIHSKYSKHWLSILWHTQLIVCAVKYQIMGYYFHFSSFLGKNSGLESRFLFCLIFQFYLMYRLICQKQLHFLSAQIALVSTLFSNVYITWDVYCITLRLVGHQSDSFYYPASHSYSPDEKKWKWLILV